MDDMFFNDASCTPDKITTFKYTKPADDFRPLPTSATSILYLAVTTPHTDEYEIHGPTPSFSQLLPKIEEICSDSPSALDKLEALQYTAPDVWGDREKHDSFAETGFTTFVVEGQRGTFVVLEIFREQSPGVRGVLPAPVYTITRHGPLVHTYSGVGVKTRLEVAKGVAATSTLVGSFVERKDAMAVAKVAMDELVGEEKVSRIDSWGNGQGGGVLLAMGVGKRWEVRVHYPDEALRSAREDANAEGMEMGWRL